VADEHTPATLIHEFYFDEAARVGQRTDWFLIFHGILLEAFFAAPDHMPKVVVALLGLLTSYLWFMTGVRQRWLSRHLGACMGNRKLMGAKFGAAFELIFEMRRRGLPRWTSWAMPISAFAVVIPFAFTAAWLSLLVWASRRTYLVLVITGLAGIFMCILATVVIIKLKNGPHIDESLVDGLEQHIDAEYADGSR
jgi:hypothetical protein